MLSLPAAFAQNRVTFHDIKAGMENRGLEHQAMWVANDRATNMRWGEEYKKAKIISPEWEVVRDYNGDTLGRFINVELYCIKSNGDCAMADFVFKEKYRDDGYSDKLICIHIGQFINIDCE